jgi:hypothetical protein
MTNKIFEELPVRSPKPSAAPAQQTAAQGVDKIQKQAKQLAYDTRYRAKQEGITLQQAWGKQSQHSDAAAQVKIIAKKMLFGRGMAEDYNISDAASNSVANALFKVFVEGVEKPNHNDQITEGNEGEYKIRITDKRTKEIKTKEATRSEITDLRSNPNLDVELVGTLASRKPTRGLDPVGKEDSDINNDGKVDKTDKYLLHRRDVRGSAIATRKEEFEILEGSGKIDQNKKPIKEMKPGETNKVTLFPDSKVQEEVELVSERAVSKAQQRFMGMVYAAKKGAKPASPEVSKAASEISSKEAKKFASTKHKGLPVHKEESECEYEYDYKTGKNKDKKVEDDPRGMKTKVNLVKNKLRAMGLKMSQELEGEMIDEAAERVKGKLQSGTRTFTGIGYYGRTSKEKKDPKKMKRVFPGPKSEKDSGDNYGDSALTASERNPNLR